LQPLTKEDFVKILKEPDNSLIKQYIGLMKTENVDLEFTDEGIDSIADISTHINSTIENIGARRLHTILEKVLEDISFTASDKSGEKIIINKDYVEKNLGKIIKDKDLSKFIL
jgi:ATP-dependent HslUV protease ATP-binding subunit HslU